ncbi:hypothetical protein ACA910_011534 [Epithemia clementina (nom. ined.)]
MPLFHVSGFVLFLISASIPRHVQGFAFVTTSSSKTTPGLRPASSPSFFALEMAKVGIFYSTSTGNTETVAGYISEAIGGGVDIIDIGDAKEEEITSCDSLIVGAPTWHTGADTERSGTAWDEWLYKTLPNLDDVNGNKKVAIFGVGDQQSYCDNFCDAAGELYDLFSAKGCKIYGMTSQEGYDHVASKAVVGDKFCGLMCDEDNQYDLSQERAKKWVEQLKSEGFM